MFLTSQKHSNVGLFDTIMRYDRPMLPIALVKYTYTDDVRFYRYFKPDVVSELNSQIIIIKRR